MYLRKRTEERDGHWNPETEVLKACLSFCLCVCACVFVRLGIRVAVHVLEQVTEHIRLCVYLCVGERENEAQPELFLALTIY